MVLRAWQHQDWGHGAISPRGLGSKRPLQSEWHLKTQVQGSWWSWVAWQWPDRELLFDPASNQMSSHDLEGPTVQPTEGSRRQVDERALEASLPLKPGLGTAIHLRGFTHGARPRPQVSLNGPLAGVLPCRARWDEFNCLLSGGYSCTRRRWTLLRCLSPAAIWLFSPIHYLL